MRRQLTVILTVLLAFGTVHAAQQPHFADVPAKDHARQNPLAGKPDATTAGSSLYRDHCAECHLADAQGDGKKKPSLRSAEVHSATDGDLEWFLRQGDLRHGMPSWSNLTQSQRWAIINYLRSLH